MNSRSLRCSGERSALRVSEAKLCNDVNARGQERVKPVRRVILSFSRGTVFKQMNAVPVPVAGFAIFAKFPTFIEHEWSHGSAISHLLPRIVFPRMERALLFVQ